MMNMTRINNLDIVKILAAIAIVFHHYQQCFSVQFEVDFLNNVLPLLGYFVELFFAISGFFTARSFAGDGGKNETFINYYTRKLLRLYPYALITVIVTAIIMLLHNCIFGCGVWGNSYSIAGIVTSFLLINQGWIIECAPALNNPIWYICVLLWIYILAYILEVLISYFFGGEKCTKLRIFFYLSISILGGVGRYLAIDFPFLHLSDFRGYATFFMGMALYILWQELSDNKHYRIAIGVFSFLGVLSGILMIVAMRKFNWYVWCYMILPGFIMLSVISPQIKLRSTEMYSEITFQLYLWHVICFYTFQFALDLSGISFVHGVASMLLVSAICFWISWGIYRTIDIPMTEYLKEKGII